MNYFITGGTGLIGAYITRRLLAEGHKVTVFDLSPDREFLVDLIGPEGRQVEVLKGDVTDFPALLRALRTSGAQKIIHLAALLSAKSNENPILSLRVNSEGTLNVFEAAIERDIGRVVWASSVAVFGAASKRPPGVMANDAPHLPTDLYGACKSLNERFSKHYRRTYGLECIGLRYAAVYGYGKSRTLKRGTGANFMYELIDKPALGQPAIVPAGDAICDFVHIDDAARATILACHVPACEPVALNIGGFRSTLRGMADIVRSILPEAEIVVEDGSWNGTDHHYDLSAAERAIGYTPQIDLASGLRENIEQIRRRVRK